MNKIISKAVPFSRRTLAQDAETYYKFTEQELIDFVNDLVKEAKSDDYDKVIRDGNVAVIVSPGHGAGFSTWNPQYPGLVYEPLVVQWIENGKPISHFEPITLQLEQKYGEFIYCGGLNDACIHWLPIGTHFIITEHDGFECLQSKSDINWSVA